VIWIATLAAVAASCGDLLLLWVAAGGERGWLIIGNYLGVLFIPLYALGYRVVSELLNVRAIFWIGAYASAIGAAIHGVTAVTILSAASTNASAGPFASLVPILPYLIPLWVLVAALSIVGSLLQVRAVRADARLPRWFAWVNPLALTVAIAGIGAAFDSLAQYVVPAAPNLAHVFYFAAVAEGRRRHGS